MSTERENRKTETGERKPAPETRNAKPETGLRRPPVCSVRSFQVYEIPGGAIEVHLTADHGQTIAWNLPPRMAAALGAKLRTHSRAAIERPMHPLGGSL